MMTNPVNQSSAWQANYDPFGNPVTITVSPVNNQRLPGLPFAWLRAFAAQISPPD